MRREEGQTRDWEARGSSYRLMRVDVSWDTAPGNKQKENSGWRREGERRYSRLAGRRTVGWKHTSRGLGGENGPQSPLGDDYDGDGDPLSTRPRGVITNTQTGQVLRTK
jgi:hypothetical protein